MKRISNPAYDGVIFQPRRRAMSRRELHRVLEPVIGEWIALTCLWESSRVGDHRFVVFAIDMAPGVQVYVQFWSDARSAVVWEVSSGDWNPPTDLWLAGARAKRIEALGFAIGGQARNYGRAVRIRTAADVARTARTVVDVFFDGFDYRGAQPIEVHFACGGRSASKEVKTRSRQRRTVTVH